MSKITEEELISAMPARLVKSINKSTLKSINDKLNDPDMLESYKDNLLSYSHILKEGRYKMESYVNAVKYVTLKTADMTNIEAFRRTFPEKIKRWQDDGVSAKDMASYVHAYNKSKLVGQLYEQLAIPFWVTNQSAYQNAINTQVELMTSANSEKVRSDAANSILTHLKPPETKKIEIDIGEKRDSVIEGLKNSMNKLVEAQRQAIENKTHGLIDITNEPLVIEHVE